MLRITEKLFDELYPDLVGLYDHFNEPVPPGISRDTFERHYLASKLWRLNNVYTIINKDGEPGIFNMNAAQHRVYAASRKHPRVIILKSRQQGISTLWLVSYFDDAVFGEHLSIGLMAQGTDEATTLLERVKFLWDKLDVDVKNFVGTTVTKDNTKEYGFSNNCTIFIRVSFRSTTLQRLHVSEFGKIANNNPQRAKETKTGTLQALAPGNTGIIESTAEGNNDFKVMWSAAVMAVQSGQMTAKDFYPVFLSWLDDPDCVQTVDQSVDNEAAVYFAELEENLDIIITKQQKNFWITQRRELGGDIYQEYPATPEEAFAASRDGTYYSRKFNESCVRKGGLVSDLYDPNLETDVFFDIGVDDYCVMLWVQYYRGVYRIVHEYWNDGYDMEFYVDIVGDVGIPVSTLRYPHDVKVRQAAGGRATGGRARRRIDIINDYIRENRLSYRTSIIPKTSVADGIELVRTMIPHMQIDPKCTYIIECLNNYSKEWDTKLQQWKTTPLHDEFSHGADTLRQVAVGHPTSGESSKAISNTRRRPTGHAV